MSDLLRPVVGSPDDVLTALERWLDVDEEPLVIRTSGSTGTPKDVFLSRDAVIASATASEARLGGRGSWLLALPVTGVAGLMVLARSILAGRMPVLADSYASLPLAIEAMPDGKRYASLVPTQLHRLTDADLEGVARLDALLIGGAPMPTDLRDRVAAAGVTVARTYGMSETCGGCVYDGIPLDGVKVRLDAEGRIELAGPTLFDGYADPAATAAVLRDGWFSTDDLGEIDDAGVLRVLGRRDDVVISGGVNIALPAVTDALRRLEGVGDAVAIAVPDVEWGSRVIACIVPADAICLDGLRLDEVRDGIEAAGLLRSWAPREVRLMDELPSLPGGKVDRYALGHHRDDRRDGRLRP